VYDEGSGNDPLDSKLTILREGFDASAKRINNFLGRAYRRLRERSLSTIRLLYVRHYYVIQRTHFMRRGVTSLPKHRRSNLYEPWPCNHGTMKLVTAKR